MSVIEFLKHEDEEKKKWLWSCIKLLAIFNVSQALKATQLGFVFY